jgi:hypothetical protein
VFQVNHEDGRDQSKFVSPARRPLIGAPVRKLANTWPTSMPSRDPRLIVTIWYCPSSETPRRPT